MVHPCIRYPQKKCVCTSTGSKEIQFIMIIQFSLTTKTQRLNGLKKKDHSLQKLVIEN